MMASAPIGGPLMGVASLDAIIRHAKHVPVFPCRARSEEGIKNGKPHTYKSKSPHTDRGFLNASQDEAQIRSWWRTWPDALVGVPTGKTSGLVVVDYDPDKHCDDTGEWIEQCTELLLSARVHTTARGGRHYLYRLPAGQGYRGGVDLVLKGKKRPGIDVRADGGYIIWWPLHGGMVTNEKAPLLPAGLIDERSFEFTSAPPRPRATPSPEAWRRDKEMVVDALSHLDPADYDQWLHAGMAIHQATAGNDEGFDLWHAFSSGGITGETPSSYAGIEDCRYRWNGFSSDRKSTITLGSVFHMAKDAGYVMPRSVAHQGPTAEFPDDPDLPPVPEDDRFGPLDGQSAPATAGIEARTFEWVDSASIPPREWLYGRHYMRGMVSATAGIGGAGKSTLLNVELVSMAIGRDLLSDGEPLPTGPLCVWGHNGEDPYVELQRRIMAVCRHYGVTREDLGGRLKITSGRDSKMLLARELKAGGSLVVPTETGAAVASEILKHGIQVFVVDPFVTIHQVNENDNGMIDDVMTVLRDLADKTNCAVEVAHHFRKLNGDDPSVDSIRGASSIVGAARSARIVAGMTKEEASKYSIEDEKRGYYSWLMNGKANMLPPSHRRQWMRMESVSLGNAKPPFKADEIGVVTRWEPPETQTDLNGPEYRMLRRAIMEANPLTQLRASSGADGWVGNLMAKTLGLNPADSLVVTQMKAMIARLLANGTLVKETLRDHAQGRSAPVVRWVAAGDQE